MKKCFFLVAPFLIVFQFCKAQTLTNWKHYYQSQYDWFNLGNSFATDGPEEVVVVDKSTMAITRYPFPAALREVNPHNSMFYDPQFQMDTYCMPYLEQGPGGSVIAYWCSGE